MELPNRKEARTTLHQNIQDAYQRTHAEMVAAATESYAARFHGDPELWWLTGLWHDLDYEQHPQTHPGPLLEWLTEWNYPEAMRHAIEAHAYGFNGYTTRPESDLARALRACDEICGIFYAYQQINPVPYTDMKVTSLLKRLRESRFAPGIERTHIYEACDELGVTLEEHIEQLRTHLPQENHA